MNERISKYSYNNKHIGIKYYYQKLYYCQKLLLIKIQSVNLTKDKKHHYNSLLFQIQFKKKLNCIVSGS